MNKITTIQFGDETLTMNGSITNTCLIKNNFVVKNNLGKTKIFKGSEYFITESSSNNSITNYSVIEPSAIVNDLFAKFTSNTSLPYPTTKDVLSGKAGVIISVFDEKAGLDIQSFPVKLSDTPWLNQKHGKSRTFAEWDSYYYKVTSGSLLYNKNLSNTTINKQFCDLCKDWNQPPRQMAIGIIFNNTDPCLNIVCTYPTDQGTDDVLLGCSCTKSLKCTGPHPKEIQYKRTWPKEKKCYFKKQYIEDFIHKPPWGVESLWSDISYSKYIPWYPYFNGYWYPHDKGDPSPGGIPPCASSNIGKCKPFKLNQCPTVDLCYTMYKNISTSGDLSICMSDQSAQLRNLALLTTSGQSLSISAEKYDGHLDSFDIENKKFYNICYDPSKHLAYRYDICQAKNTFDLWSMGNSSNPPKNQFELNGFLSMPYFIDNSYLCTDNDSSSCGVIWNDIGNRRTEDSVIIPASSGEITQCTDPSDNKAYMSLYKHYIDPSGGPVTCPGGDKVSYKIESDLSNDMIYQMFKNGGYSYNEIIIHMDFLDKSDKLTDAPDLNKFNPKNILAFFILQSELNRKDNTPTGQITVLKNVVNTFNNMYSDKKFIVVIDDTMNANTTENPFSVYKDDPN